MNTDPKVKELQEMLINNAPENNINVPRVYVKKILSGCLWVRWYNDKLDLIILQDVKNDYFTEDHLAEVAQSFIKGDETYEAYYPDNDPIEWQIRIGNNFHGFPCHLDWLHAYTTKEHYHGTQETNTIWLSIKLIDEAS